MQVRCKVSAIRLLYCLVGNNKKQSELNIVSFIYIPRSCMAEAELWVPGQLGLHSNNKVGNKIGRLYMSNSKECSVL